MSLRRSLLRVSADRHPNRSRAERRFARRRQILVESLESRQLLAGDTGFIDSLPTFEEALFGNLVMTPEGREVCLAFKGTSSLGEGEGGDNDGGLIANGLGDGSTNVDITSGIVQPAGPLAPGAAFESVITFGNAGPGFAPDTNLTVDFDAALDAVTWERVLTQTQAAVVPAAELDGTDGFSLDGAASLDSSGFAVAGAGDFNGDGIDDAIVAAPVGNQVHVVFGNASGFGSTVALGSSDATFSGVASDDEFGFSVSSAGDVNGDGIDDIVVGAPSADSTGLTDAGAAYVIFGSTTLADIDLSTSPLDGTNGFTVFGLASFDRLGTSVGMLGDFDNDGNGDVILGAPGVDLPVVGGDPLSNAGAAYAILGIDSTASFAETVDLGALTGTTGVVFNGVDSEDGLGGSVDGAGDINNDGISDVVIGARQFLGDQSGQAYVVFGSSTAFTSPVPAGSLNGTNGFLIDGVRADQLLGTSVSGLGDVSGDGIDDLIISEGATSTQSARSYVVFGSGSAFSATFDLTTLTGSNGFTIDAEAADNPQPMAVSDAGDVNGDGINDLIVGNPETTSGSTTIAGGTYVVYGGSSFAATLGLGALDGTDGFKIEGVDLFDNAGFSVAAAGDINGDGLDDVIVGAPFASPSSATLSGQSYIVYGRGTLTTTGTGDIDELVDIAPGDTVVYTVAATIAAGASGSTTVNAEAIVAAGLTDTVTGNNTASAVTTIGAPPMILDVLVNDGINPSRSQVTSLTVLFDSLVDTNLLLTAFTLENLSDGISVGSLSVVSDDTSGSTVTTITFSGASVVDRLGTGELGDSLADGNYRLTIDRTKVVASSVEMENDRIDEFFRFYGDVNGDRRVTAPDIQVFGPAFGSTVGDANFNASLDANGDGRITAPDIQEFGPKFGSTLP